MFSPKSTIYQTGWLDLVFANRNKAYGAYELRQNADRRLIRALFISCLFVVAVFSYPLVSRHFSTVEDLSSIVEPEVDKEKVFIVNLPQLKKPEPKSSPAPAIPKTEPIKLKTTRWVEPVVVSTPVVDNPPTMAQLQNSVISDQNADGAATTSNATAPVSNVSGNGDGLGDVSGNGNTPVTMDMLQRYPEFPGGIEAFMKFLRKNLRYPAQAVDEGITGKVFVNFVIEKDGRLTDIKILRGIGYGCDEEAIRVLKKSPAWSPGFQNDRTVRVLYTIPLMFHLGE